MLKRIVSSDNGDGEIAAAGDCIARARQLAPLIEAHAAETEAARGIAPGGARRAARGPAVPHADAAVLRRHGARAGELRAGDRGDRQGRRQHRLVRRAGLGLLDDGGLSGAQHRARRIRRAECGAGVGPDRRQAARRCGRGRLPRHRHLAVSRAGSAMPPGSAGTASSSSRTAACGWGTTASRSTAPW